MSTPADEEVTEADRELGDVPELEAGDTPDTVVAEVDFDDAELAETSDTDVETPDDTDTPADSSGAAVDAARADSAETAAVTAGSAADSADPADDDGVADEYAESTAARIPPARSPARVADPDENPYDDTESGEAEYGDAPYADADPAESGHEGDPDFVPTRRGRGGYDPEADAIARAARYTFRQRAVLGLVLTAILCGALGVAVEPTAWWGCGLSVVVLVTYLAYLRKQVRMEEDIRRRRAARLTRGHREHDDEEDAAAEFSRRAEQHIRRTMDRDTARALRRRSKLLEADDEDPTFHHLDPFDPATARALRRAAAAEMRRAAGE